MSDATSSFKFPTAFTILFALIAAMAAATWVVDVGQYDRVENAELGKEVPVPGSFKSVEPNPQGIGDVVLAPINGFFDIDSYEVRAMDVALFVLFIGGFLGVVNATGAIDVGIKNAMLAMAGKEKWMIPILMALFAAGGTIYGMAEESLAFYAILIPVMIRAGYDAVTGVAIIMLGAAIGTLGSTINPFATVIASNAAGVPFTDGIGLRLVILVLGWLICVIYVMRYAEKVRKDPAASLVAHMKEDNEQHFLSEAGDDGDSRLTGRQKLILAVFGLSFAVMIYGVSMAGWWMARMATVFMVAAIIVAVIDRMSEENLVKNFVAGAGELLGVALIIGVARGVVVIMDAGFLSDTVLHWSVGVVTGLSDIAFINAMYWLQVLMSFFVPSSSGLAIGRVRYDVWLRFTWPLLLMLTILIMAVLSVGTIL